MRALLLLLLPLAVSAQQDGPLIVYSRTTFPGQPVNALLELIDWTKGNITNQYHRLRDSAGLDPRALKEPFFHAEMLLQPVKLRTVISPHGIKQVGRSLTADWAYLSLPGEGAAFSIQPHDEDDGLSVDLIPDSLHRVWVKYLVDTLRYTVRRGGKGETVAGYPCREAIFEAPNNTLYNASGRLYSFPPHRVRILYTEALHPQLNIQLPYHIPWKGAILKVEAWLDKEGVKRLVHEVTALEKGVPEGEEWRIPQPSPRHKYDPASEEALHGQLVLISGTLSMKM